MHTAVASTVTIEYLMVAAARLGSRTSTDLWRLRGNISHGTPTDPRQNKIIVRPGQENPKPFSVAAGLTDDAVTSHRKDLAELIGGLARRRTARRPDPARLSGSIKRASPPSAGSHRHKTRQEIQQWRGRPRTGSSVPFSCSELDKGTQRRVGRACLITNDTVDHRGHRVSMEYAKQCMNIREAVSAIRLDPVDFGAQSDLIGGLREDHSDGDGSA